MTTRQIIADMTSQLKLCNMTKRKLADNMGVSRQRVYDIFRADNLQTSTIEKVYAAMGKKIRLVVVSEE